MLEKTTFKNISKLNKQIVLFGSGNVASKAIQKLDRTKIEFIVDNALVEQGKTFEGLKVKNPNQLTKDYFISVRLGFPEISQQLRKMGLEPNKDFVMSPVLNDLIMINNLEELEQTLFFTCGGVENTEPLTGGGLYKCEIKGTDVNISKVHSGASYGIIKFDDRFIFIDTNKGVFEYRDNKTMKIADLPSGARAPGGFIFCKKKLLLCCMHKSRRCT